MNTFCIYFWLIAALANTLIAQPETTTTPKALSVTEFNTLLRDMDLNADIQNGYSITKSEYQLLLNAWNSLQLPDKRYLMDSSEGWKDFAKMLLFDFLIDTPWEGHIKKAARYNAKGLSLTASRYKSNISLKRARKTLVDFLHKGPSMFVGGRLVLTDQIKMRAKERVGSKALRRLEKWQELINNHLDCPDWWKLTAVNSFFNGQITETPDREDSDYWQSPIETLVRGKGDCDDFAIAKYVSLRLLGIPTEQLWLGVVAHPYWGGHCVLFFYPSHEHDPWVLDNLISEHLGSDFGAILRLSSRMRFDEIKPLWGINENVLTEFNDNLSETVTHNDPREAFPAFATALANSQRLLPPEKELSLAHNNTSSETWRDER